MDGTLSNCIHKFTLPYLGICAWRGSKSTLSIRLELTLLKTLLSLTKLDFAWLLRLLSLSDLLRGRRSCLRLAVSKLNVTVAGAVMKLNVTVAGCVLKLNVTDCPGDLIFMGKLEYSLLNMFRQGLILSNLVRIRLVDIGSDSLTLE